MGLRDHVICKHKNSAIIKTMTNILLLLVRQFFPYIKYGNTYFYFLFQNGMATD
jgi:hypothetical protein